MFPPKKVVVTVPATTANIGPGFDVFGMALDYPRDKVTIAPMDKGIQIEVSGLGKDIIPTNPNKNTAGVVAKAILDEFSLKTGLRILLEKGIVPSAGLGSSAASAVAVAFGVNRLFNLKLDKKQLTHLSSKGEVASAGVEHADNVSAAIYGGFTIIKSYNPLEIVHLKTPKNLGICIAIPKARLSPKKTEKARSVLPKVVSIEKMVHNVGNAATMAAGFAMGDVALIGRAMSDAVVEPVRSPMIPGYEKVKEKALEAGACGVSISGAGPAMVAILDSANIDASKVSKAMIEGFKTVGVCANAFSTKPGKGVHLVEVKE